MFLDPATLPLGSPTASFKSNGGIRLREGVHRLIVVMVTKRDYITNSYQSTKHPFKYLPIRGLKKQEKNVRQRHKHVQPTQILPCPLGKPLTCKYSPPKLSCPATGKNECTSDESCHSSKMCCFNGCIKTCISPSLYSG